MMQPCSSRSTGRSGLSSIFSTFSTEGKGGPRPCLGRPRWNVRLRNEPKLPWLAPYQIERFVEDLLHIGDVLKTHRPPAPANAIFASDHGARFEVEHEPVLHVRVAGPQRVPFSDRISLHRRS